MIEIYTEHDSEIKRFVDNLSERALVIYRSLKHAAADLHWEHIQFSGSIRSTIHTKHIPVLGLRIYPEYKLRSRLLPYHGIALFYRDVTTKDYKMEVIPEAIICSKQNVTRIVDKKNVTQGYLLNEGEVI